MFIRINRKLFVSRFLNTAVAVLCLSVMATIPVNAETKVGKSAKIQNIVIGSNGQRKLNVPDAVYAGEKISAKIESHGELLLDDDSKIIVGENSIVSLDDFAVSDGGIKKGTVRLAKGALRFITGNARKGTYTITTPVSTIGVRGTALDVYHAIRTYILLLKGEIIACGSASCIVTKRACDIVEINTDGSAAILPFLHNKDANKQEEEAKFNLLSKQERFAPPWRLRTHVCDIRRANAFLDKANEFRWAQPGDPDSDDGDDGKNDSDRQEQRY